MFMAIFVITSIVFWAIVEIINLVIEEVKQRRKK